VDVDVDDRRQLRALLRNSKVKSTTPVPLRGTGYKFKGKSWRSKDRNYNVTISA
jgi:hypothetical protein